jgi:hypothetical protein
MREEEKARTEELRSLIKYDPSGSRLWGDAGWNRLVMSRAARLQGLTAAQTLVHYLVT